MKYVLNAFKSNVCSLLLMWFLWQVWALYLTQVSHFFYCLLAACCVLIIIWKWFCMSACLVMLTKVKGNNLLTMKNYYFFFFFFCGILVRQFLDYSIKIREVNFYYLAVRKIFLIWENWWIKFKIVLICGWK